MDEVPKNNLINFGLLDFAEILTWLLRSRFYFCLCVVAFNAKVIYRSAVISAENILCVPWFFGSLYINRIILFITKEEIGRKRSFNNLSNEYKFSYVP